MENKYEVLTVTHILEYKKKLTVSFRVKEKSYIKKFKDHEAFETYCKNNGVVNEAENGNAFLRVLPGKTWYFKKDKEGIFKPQHKESLWKKIRNAFNRSWVIGHISFLWHWDNFFFCLKYPFWRSRNVWTGKFNGYGHTWYDDIPEGWKIAFGKQLSDDIKAAFLEDKKENPKLNWKNALYWEQIKEKYGGLRLYASATKRIQDVLSHYESISENYCIACGAPARFMTSGYILPLCSDCFDKTAQAKAIKEKLPKQYLKYKRDHRIVKPKKGTKNTNKNNE